MGKIPAKRCGERLRACRARGHRRGCPWRKLAIILGAALAGAAGAFGAHAEEPGGQERQDFFLAEIDVSAPPGEFRQFEMQPITGSSIVRREQTQALPVQVITREDIRRSGLKTVVDVVHSLPVMGNFVEASQLGMIAGGYSNAAIHGLPAGTLVLVDGLRLAPFGRATVAGPERSSVDLSTLLLADVERIEVLTDGASSLYGTDAIAGVVNIIMRKERRGWELSADYMQPAGGAGKGWVSSIGWGHGQLQRDGYSLLLSAELARRQELLGGERPYASQGRYEFESGGRRYAVQGDMVNPSGSPATLVQDDAVFVNRLYRNGSCAAGSIGLAGQAACLSSPYGGMGIYPAEEARRLHARGELALAGGHTLFADVLWGRNVAIQSAYWWPRAVSQIGLPEGSAAYEQARDAGLDPARTRLQWRPDLPALHLASVQTNGRVQLGASGEWQAWNYRSSAYFAQSRAQFQADSFSDLNYGSLGIADGGIWANDNVLRPLDAGNPLTGQVEALRGGLKTLSGGVSRIYGLQASASRALAEIGGKDVLLGTGIDLRTETSQFENFVPAALRLESPGFDVRRQVRGVFGELQIPVTPAWEVNLGARSDYYSDVGASNNAKLSSRWEVTPEWSMRASIGTGFRAPAVAQTQSLGTPYVWGIAPQKFACNAAQQEIARRLGASNGVAGECYSDLNPFVLGDGNPELKPEKSTQLTWGMAFMANRNLRLAADFWFVRIRDMIQVLSYTKAFEDPLRYAANYRVILPGYESGGARPGELALYLPLQNLGMSEKSGIDFEAQWRHPGDWGRWNFSAQGTWLLRSRTKATPDAESSSDLAQFATDSGNLSPRLRLRVMGGLTHEQSTAQLIMNYTSGYRDLPVEATDLADGSTTTVTRRVRAFATWDLQLRHSVNRQLDLRLGVRNLFNQQAPLSFVGSSRQVFGANAVYSNLWGRVLEMGVSLRF